MVAAGGARRRLSRADGAGHACAGTAATPPVSGPAGTVLAAWPCPGPPVWPAGSPGRTMWRSWRKPLARCPGLGGGVGRGCRRRRGRLGGDLRRRFRQQRWRRPESVQQRRARLVDAQQQLRGSGGRQRQPVGLLLGRGRFVAEDQVQRAVLVVAQRVAAAERLAVQRVGRQQPGRRRPPATRRRRPAATGRWRSAGDSGASRPRPRPGCRRPAAAWSGPPAGWRRAGPGRPARGACRHCRTPTPPASRCQPLASRSVAPAAACMRSRAARSPAHALLGGMVQLVEIEGAAGDQPLAAQPGQYGLVGGVWRVPAQQLGGVGEQGVGRQRLDLLARRDLHVQRAVGARYACGAGSIATAA